MAKTEKFRVEEVETALWNHAGLVSEAARALECSVRTIYHYLERHPELADIRRQVVERMNDIAEGHSYRAIQNGDLQHIRWWLSRKAAHRGYSDKVDVAATVEVQKPREVTIRLIQPGDTLPGTQPVIDVDPEEKTPDE